MGGFASESEQQGCWRSILKLRTSPWSKLRRIASMIECKLHPSKRQTAFGGLCALGHLLASEGVLEPLSGVKIDQKTVVHSPAEKLTDALMGMLSGCKAIYETNVRVSPGGPLSRAFGRERVAEQSTIQRTLEAFTQENVAQLREAVEAIGSRYSRLLK